MFSFLKKKPKNNPDGENIIFHKGSKQVMAKFHMANGELHGRFERYYLDGAVSLKADFSEGLLQGLATEWSTMANCNRVEEIYSQGVCVQQKLMRGSNGDLVHYKKTENGDTISPILQETIMDIINGKRN